MYTPFLKVYSTFGDLKWIKGEGGGDISGGGGLDLKKADLKQLV